MVGPHSEHEGEDTEESFDKLRPAYMRAVWKEARMMLRCEHCGGHAIPGLAHLHGNPCKALCHTCTQRQLERQELERKAEAEAKKRVCESCNRSLPRAA